MVSSKSVEEQLKNIKFSTKSWGRSEISELPNILLDDEKIFECVNGNYEGGFALLVATNIRLLLIDKKPLKFLTVEDLRFDMINQIDYSHRLMGARINVSAGNKNLKFTSFNQQRLRKLINHIQHRMAEVKNEQSSSNETQQQHLERINQQLQSYLLAQHQQQEDLRLKLEQAQQQTGEVVSGTQTTPASTTPLRPAPELADFLYAQSLMQQYRADNPTADFMLPAPQFTLPSSAVQVAPNQSTAPESAPTVTSLALQLVPLPAAPATSPAAPATSPAAAAPAAVAPATVIQAQPQTASIASDDAGSLVEAGRREIFGARARAVVKPLQAPFTHFGMEINPLKVAYAKLPTLLRHRRAAGAKTAAPQAAPSTKLVPGHTIQIAGA